VEYAIIAGAIVVFAILIAWLVTIQRRVFVIRIRQGVATVARGKLPPAFVAEVGDVIRRFGIRQGTIHGVPRRGKVGLGFSRSIPAQSHQALRNVWTMHAR
jgi:hypothetical protein